MWWIVNAAERQRRITRAISVGKLSQIGRFLSERAAFEHEWNISIKPIQLPSSKADIEKLKSDYFQGGRVRVEHIHAELDVPREHLLNEVHQAFSKNNVVVVRAASGQGKTTLAYRYLIDNVPNDFRFEVLRASDLQHARRLATAISGHTKALEIPTVVYVDVRPGDQFWVETVRELASEPGIRVLITIREEDWFRAQVTSDDFRFSDVSLPFDRGVASSIYETLRTGNQTNFLNFDEAWAKLGERKTLFEFAYLVTQAEDLAQKIKSQIATIRDQANSGNLSGDELQLLRLVSVATAFEARLDVSRVDESLQIPDLSRALERFNNEYLLRTTNDGKWVEGFHAIRSEIIADELTDEAFSPRHQLEADVITLLNEEDLEHFLLSAFSRRDEQPVEILQQLSQINLNSWLGIKSVMTALHWLGLREYAEANEELISNVRKAFGSAWWFMLDWDLAQIKGKGGFQIVESLKNLSKEHEFAADSIPTLQSQQSDKNDVFEHWSKWLRRVDIELPEPTSESDFVAASEVLYWLGHLGLQGSVRAAWVKSKDFLSNSCEDLPIQLFSRLACGAQKYNSEVYQAWLEKNRQNVEARFRQAAGVFALEHEKADDCLTSHFIIDIEREASNLSIGSEEANINDMAVQRVDAASFCLSGYQSYGASGYGHRMAFVFDTLGDDSHKRMPIENIVMPWLPSFNALSRGVVVRQFRPNSWSEYFSKIHRMRSLVIRSMVELRKAIRTTQRTGKIGLEDSETWRETSLELTGSLFLPQTAVDPWGFESESRREEPRNRNKTTAISILDNFNKAINEFTSDVSAFMDKAEKSLAYLHHYRNARDNAKRQAIVAKAKELKISDETVRFSVIHGFDSCIELQKVHLEERLLADSGTVFPYNDSFRIQETAEIEKTLRSWSHFTFPEEVAEKPATGSSRKKNKRSSRSRTPVLRDCLRKTRNRVADSLKQLTKHGIYAKVISERVRWEDNSALWISFNVDHPISSLIAIEKMWSCLLEAFKPDRDKIVRAKTIELNWKRIVLVPLVLGKSLEGQALPHMNGVVCGLDEELEANECRLGPMSIPQESLNRLELKCWARHPIWDVFDNFTVAYQALFFHVDHMADFQRCNVELDDLGEEIFKKYLEKEQGRTNPLLQATFDSAAEVFQHFPEIDEDVVSQRSDIFNCMQLIVDMQDSLYPKEGFSEEARLTIDEIAEWRDRMKTGFELLGQARYMWIADSLNLPSFEFPT
ncbi:hypothetical protein [Mariniblastus fucicola]|nr:hypothetical protein [Mariniblastus fucicola]